MEINHLLKAELDWIDKNSHLYSSPIHAMAVQGNITKRYKINDLNKKIKELEKYSSDTSGK